MSFFRPLLYVFRFQLSWNLKNESVDRKFFPELGWDVIYQAWDVVFYHQMNREERWQDEAQRSIFDELRGVLSGDKKVCRMLYITSQTKLF